MKTARVRVRRWRLKDSPVWVHTFPDQRYRDEAWIMQDVKDALAAHSADKGNYGGFALVLWDRNGASTVAQQTWHGLVTMEIPDFVRERLMADRIERWLRADL